MAKRYKIILSVLLVVLVATAAVVVSGVLDINNRLENGNTDTSNESTDYTDVYTVDTSVALPLMHTDFDNVFFTMSKEGEVTFYEIQKGVIKTIPETGSFDVKAECSSQELPAKIHYIQRDGKINGYGLFTNLIYPDVMLYDYAFFKVTDMFYAFKDSKGTLLMLLDTDHERFYSDDKVYSEAFYLYGDHTCKHFLSESQRTVDMYARLKSDYKMFTDGILDQGESRNVLFFTSRMYVSFEESDKVDIFTSGGEYTNVDNEKYIEDIATLDFWKVNGETLYLTETQADDGEPAFELMAYDGSEKRSVKAFSGDPDEDYIIYRDYILSRLTGEIYNVRTNKAKTLSYEKFNSEFAPDTFAISKNGRFCAVRGSVGGKAICGIADLDSDKVIVYTDDVFGYIANMQALDDGTVIISTANGESGTAFYQLTALLA